MRTQAHVCSDGESLAEHVKNWLVDMIGRHFIDPENDPTYSVALSGGSTPKRLYELLAEVPPGMIPWEKVVLIWGDERNVPIDHEDSNYRMVKEALLDKVQIPSENILVVPSPGDDPRESAQQYESILRDRLPAGLDGVPKINCVLLGIGDDVHTASLFPETEALNESSRIVTANHVPKLDCWRITLTAPILNAANDVAFLINGHKKTEALNTLWHAPRNPTLYPAQLIAPKDGRLWFMLDTEAMGSTPLPEAIMVQLM